jgi:prevent-host-death family protein
MRIASLAEVKAKLSAFLNEVGTTGPVVITRNGKAVAVLLAPVDDDDLERLLLSRSPRFRSVLARSRASLRAGKGIPHDAFWKTVNQETSKEPQVADRRRVSDERRGAGKRRPPRE